MVDGKPSRKSAKGEPEPGVSELEVKMEPKMKLPKKGSPLRLSKRARRTSAPILKVWLPRVMLTLSAHWKRFSKLRLELPPPQPSNCCDPLMAPEKLKLMEGNPFSGNGNKATRFCEAKSTPLGASPTMLPL